MSCPSLQQIREGQAFHTGKMHEALNRELENRIVKRLDAQDRVLQEISAQLETIYRVVNG